MQKQKLPEQYLPSLAEYGLDWIDPAAAVLLKYDRCEWMLRAEQPIEYLYILLSGKAKVCMSDESGRNLLLCYYVSEGMMGDIELLMGRREAISSVQAVSQVVCIGLPLSVYAPMLLSHLPFVLRAAKGLAIKLHDSVANTTEIILRPFETRLCEYLLQTAQKRRVLRAIDRRGGAAGRELPPSAALAQGALRRRLAGKASGRVSSNQRSKTA